MKERATVVCRRRDKVLLVTRDRSRWTLPGGTIRRAESALEAAAREVEEETALVVARLTYLFQFGGLGKRHHVFLADLPDTAAARARNEIARCRWVRPEQVPTLTVSVPTRKIVELIFHHDNGAVAATAADAALLADVEA